MVDWRKFHVGFSSKFGTLFIGYGNKKKGNEAFKWTGKSEDRTEEIVRAVMSKLKNDCEKRKDDRPYVGYEVDGVGKLIYIKPGHNFYVHVNPEKNKN